MGLSNGPSTGEGGASLLPSTRHSTPACTRHFPPPSHGLASGDTGPQRGLPWSPRRRGTCSLPVTLSLSPALPAAGLLPGCRAMSTGLVLPANRPETTTTHRVQKLIVQLHVAHLSNPEE